MAINETRRNESSAKLPLFYTKPVPITSAQHARAKFKSRPAAPFAHQTGFIPLILSDIAEAAKHYPIVFTMENTPMPVAIVGLEKYNYFVNPEGKWTTRYYIPSYVRKYPFIFIEKSPDELILGIDEPELLGPNDEDGLPLYDGDNISPHTTQAINFCQSYQQKYQQTMDFCAELDAMGLLSPHTSKVELKNKRRIDIGGFQLIDQAQLSKLSKNDVFRWQKNGYLALIHYVQQSVTNWQTLIDLAYAHDVKMTGTG